MVRYGRCMHTHVSLDQMRPTLTAELLELSTQTSFQARSDRSAACIESQAHIYASQSAWIPI
jgi:hypothetical protein